MSDEDEEMIVDGEVVESARVPRELQAAAYHGRLVELVNLLDAGGDIHQSYQVTTSFAELRAFDELGNLVGRHTEPYRSYPHLLDHSDPPLSWAAGGGQLDVVNYLLLRGADPNRRFGVNERGRPSALHWAVWYQHYAVATVLVEAGAAVDLHHWYFRRPLALLFNEPGPLSDAARTVAQMMIFRGADIAWCKKLRRFREPTCVKYATSVAMLALNHQDDTRFDTLVHLEGVDPRARCERGNSLLHLAAAKGRRETLLYLLGRTSAPVDVVNDAGESLLDVLNASMARDTQMVTILLAAGVPLHTRDKNGNTPLHHAMRVATAPHHPHHRNTDAAYACLLLEAGADPCAFNNRFETPVYAAARADARDKIIAYVNCIISVFGEVKDACILPACIEGLAATVSSVKPEYRPEVEMAFITQLLDLGAPINGRDAEGRTALHKLAERRTPWSTHTHAAALCEMLLRRGADVCLQDELGDTVCHLAARRGNLTMLQHLMKTIGDTIGDTTLGSKNGNGETIIHLLCHHGNELDLDLVLALISRGVSIHASNSSGYTALHLAKNVDVARVLLAAGASVHLASSIGHTPLHEAFANDRRDVCHLLLAHGADAFTRDMYGRLPHQLHPKAGAFPHDHTFVELVAIHGPASIFGSLYNPEEELHALAESCGDVARTVSLEVDTSLANDRVAGAGDIASMLLPDAVDDIFLAAQRGDLESVLHFLDRADVNTPDKLGFTPLHHACAGGDFDTVEALLAHHADVSARDTKSTSEGGFTPLLLAVVHGHWPLLGLLVEHGAEINVVSVCTAHYAAAHDDIPEVLDAFVSWGGDVNARTNQNGTALHVACEHGNLLRAQRLLQAGANLNVVYSFDVTPIGLAAFAGSEALVRLLLEAGADPCARSLLGLSLEAAISVRHSHRLQPRRAPPSVLHPLRMTLATNKRYVSRDADDVPRDSLRAAVETGDELKAATLIYGCKMDVNNSSLRNPLLTTAARGGYVGMCSLLLDAGAHIDARDPDRDTALHVAVRAYHEVVAVFLINFGADVSMSNALGITALHLAAANVLPTTVARLIAAGAHINTCDHKNRNALHFAGYCDSMKQWPTSRVDFIRHPLLLSPIQTLDDAQETIDFVSPQTLVVKMLVAAGINIFELNDYRRHAWDRIAHLHELAKRFRFGATQSFSILMGLQCLPYEVFHAIRQVMMLRLGDEQDSLRYPENPWTWLPNEVLELVFGALISSAIVLYQRLEAPPTSRVRKTVFPEENRWARWEASVTPIREALLRRLHQTQRLSLHIH